jgi:hypothetical protein
MWPVSWAITPITSSGLSLFISSPVLMNIRWPAVTKAFRLLSTTR